MDTTPYRCRMRGSRPDTDVVRLPDSARLAWGVTDQPSAQDIERRVFEMRGKGAPWVEIQRDLGLTRQQARYAYQRALRAERRKAKRS